MSVNSSFACPFESCSSQSYSGIDSFNTHLRRKHSEDRKCPICAATFETSPQLHSHIRVHLIPDHVPIASSAEKPTSLALHAFESRKITENCPIVKAFKGILNLEREDSLNYGGFVNIMHPTFKIPLVSCEYVWYQDLHGDGKACHRAGENFVKDHLYPRDKQASQEHYVGSGYTKGHMASLLNHQMNTRDFYSTYVFTNASPMKSTINSGILNTIEEVMRNQVRNSGRALFISFSGLPKNQKDVEFLVGEKLVNRQEGKREKVKNTETGVAIPDFFGKILIFRDLEGLHVKGWKVHQTDKFEERAKRLYQSEERVAPFLYDPFKLAEEVGFPLTANRRIFATINLTKNQDKSVGEGVKVLPTYTAFFDFLKSRENHDVASGIPKKRKKIETVISHRDEED